jgi:carbonic anhydrase/acetyltransferase-like protein (isoleucine patch superfamily)
VLDNAYLESGCIVAAGAVVLENTRVPAGTIWAGVPAVQVKVNDMEKAVVGMRLMAESYAKYKTWYEDLKVD